MVKINTMKVEIVNQSSAGRTIVAVLQFKVTYQTIYSFLWQLDPLWKSREFEKL